MITAIKWAAWVLLWVIAVAFAWSDVLCVMTLIHYRKDKTMVFIICAAILAFTVIAAGAVYTAMKIGRCL